MSINLYLSSHAHVQSILIVSGILLGAKKEIGRLNDKNKTEFVTVPNAKLKYQTFNMRNENNFNNCFSNMFICKIKNSFSESYSYNLHFDNNALGQRLLSFSPTPIETALAKKMLEIFGGKLCMHHDDSSRDIINSEYIFKPEWAEETDDGFDSKHKFFKDLYPLSPIEIYNANALSSIPLSEEDLQVKCETFKKLYTAMFEKNISNDLNKINLNKNKTKI